MSYLPEGFSNVTPHLLVSDAKAALALYEKALNATILHVMEMPGTGKVMHAGFKIGNAMLFLSDPMPFMSRKPAGPDGATTAFYVYVEDVDAAFAHASTNGMKAIDEEPMDMFWGDRTAVVQDPYGYNWTLATKQRDVSPEDMAKAMEQMATSS